MLDYGSSIWRRTDYAGIERACQKGRPGFKESLADRVEQYLALVDGRPFDATKFDAACDVTPVTVGALTGDPLQIRDPWGNQFRYARASNTVTGAESCPTPAAIVSLGPDGALGTGDDYVYYASLAEWKDIFSKSGW